MIKLAKSKFSGEKYAISHTVASSAVREVSQDSASGDLEESLVDSDVQEDLVDDDDQSHEESIIARHSTMEVNLEGGGGSSDDLETTQRGMHGKINLRPVSMGIRTEGASYNMAIPWQIRRADQLNVASSTDNESTSASTTNFKQTNPTMRLMPSSSHNLTDSQVRQPKLLSNTNKLAGIVTSGASQASSSEEYEFFSNETEKPSENAIFNVANNMQGTETFPSSSAGRHGKRQPLHEKLNRSLFHRYDQVLNEMVQDYPEFDISKRAVSTEGPRHVESTTKTEGDTNSE